jgi:hypothetical protein
LAFPQCILTPDAQTPVNMTGPYSQLAVPEAPIRNGSCADVRGHGFEGLAAKLTDGVNFYFESALRLPNFVRGKLL